MKSVAVLASGILVLAAALPASAAGPYWGGVQFRPYAQQQGARPAPRRDADRRVPQREAERRPPQRDAGQDGRMSPEERRQLRRDIHDAGKEIYRGGAPRRGERRGQ